MSKTELKEVENYKVFNEFGSIEFFGITDLTQVDLCDIVTISQSNVEVYDDVRHAQSKPAVGYKLNKPALITLNNIRPLHNQSAVQKESKLRNSLLKRGDSEHLSYDGDKFTWQFKVAHFTKWGEGDDDDEEMKAEPANDLPSPVDIPSPSLDL